LGCGQQDSIGNDHQLIIVDDLAICLAPHQCLGITSEGAIGVDREEGDINGREEDGDFP
jgi:hypothetical protein